MPDLTKPSLSPFFTFSQDLLCIAGIDGYLKDANPAFMDLLGYSKEELLAIPYTYFIHPDDAAVIQKMTRNDYTQKVFQEIDIRFRKKRGTYCRITWIVVKRIDEVFYMMGMGGSRQQQLTRATIAGQEQERAQIGRELHDNINQMITALKLHLNMAREKKEVCMELICKCENISTAVIEEIRTLSKQLLPPLLDKGDLPTAIEELLATYHGTLPFKTYFTYCGKLECLPPDLHLCIYRIIQEGLNNIIKHAGATEVLITLKAGAHLSLMIQDNGRGFDTRKRRPGIGITNIINRADVFNGKVNVFSAPGKGCRLELRIADLKRLQIKTPLMVDS